MNWRTNFIATAPLTSGCVSMGPDYDPALVKQLQPGTSKSEVIAQLGQPTPLVSLPDGRQQLTWTQSRGTMLSTASARSIMPMFGADGRNLGLVSQAETDLR